MIWETIKILFKETEHYMTLFVDTMIFVTSMVYI